jgi:XRE family transcriptional regulator, regulator of sulfur utilization
MEKSNVYGEKCRKVRVLRGYSQDYMAQKLGLRDPKAYSRYETGETAMTLPMLEAIAEVFEMESAAHLMSFDDKAFFSQCTGAMGVHSQNTYNAASEKERELYEARIRHLEEEVLFLREQLKVRG